MTIDPLGEIDVAGPDITLGLLLPPHRNPDSAAAEPRFPLLWAGCNGTIKACDGEFAGCVGDPCTLGGRCLTSLIPFSSLANSIPGFPNRPFLRPIPERPRRVCWCLVRAILEEAFSTFLEAMPAALAILASAAAWRETALWRALNVRVKKSTRTACDTRTRITALQKYLVQKKKNQQYKTKHAWHNSTATTWSRHFSICTVDSYEFHNNQKTYMLWYISRSLVAPRAEAFYNSHHNRMEYVTYKKSLAAGLLMLVLQLLHQSCKQQQNKLLKVERHNTLPANLGFGLGVTLS